MWSYKRYNLIFLINNNLLLKYKNKLNQHKPQENLQFSYIIVGYILQKFFFAISTHLYLGLSPHGLGQKSSLHP